MCPELSVCKMPAIDAASRYSSHLTNGCATQVSPGRLFAITSLPEPESLGETCRAVALLEGFTCSWQSTWVVSWWCRNHIPRTAFRSRGLWDPVQQQALIWDSWTDSRLMRSSSFEFHCSRAADCESRAFRERFRATQMGDEGQVCGLKLFVLVPMMLLHRPSGHWICGQHASWFTRAHRFADGRWLVLVRGHATPSREHHGANGQRKPIANTCARQRKRVSGAVESHVPGKSWHRKTRHLNELRDKRPTSSSGKYQ